MWELIILLNADFYDPALHFASILHPAELLATRSVCLKVQNPSQISDCAFWLEKEKEKDRANTTQNGLENWQIKKGVFFWAMFDNLMFESPDKIGLGAWLAEPEKRTA